MFTDIAILAGGKSSRMGTDKASLTVEGEPLLLRTARLAALVTGTVPKIIGRECPTDWPEDLTAEFLPDAVAEVGPLGGLLAALRATDGPVLVLSCDLPALEEMALRWLLDQPRGPLGVITRNGDQWEPLFAIYTPACLPLVEANLTAKRRSLHALITAGGEEFAFADAPAGISTQLLNVNTPEEWERFRQRS